MRRVFLAGLLFVGAAGAVQTQGSNDFRWTGTIEPGRVLEIKGVNGAIRAELASGNQIDVVATKRARRSDPADVRVEVVQENGNVTICAVYPTPSSRSWWGTRRDDDRPNECRPGSSGHMNVRDNDTAVDFVVKVPEGVRFAARTVNGGVSTQPLKSDVLVKTVNGKIDLATSGAGEAATVNGSIDASVGTVAGSGEMAFKTVNGSITLRVPRTVNANLYAKTVNGRFSSDLPLMIKSMSRHNRRVEGTLGSGGRDLRLDTVNGSIHLQLVTAN